MGVLDSRQVTSNKKISNLKAIEDIYLMFQQSNKVIIASIKNQNPRMTASKIKNIDNLLDELLDPFLQHEKYTWGGEIFNKFKSQFSKNFQIIWSANRQQFYQLLLINCNASVEGKNNQTFQNYFFNVSVHKIQQQIPNSELEILQHEQEKLILMNDSILMNGMNGPKQIEMDVDIPLFLPVQHVKVEVEMAQMLKEQIQKEPNLSKQIYSSRMRMQNCSLLLPETVFVGRLSQSSQFQVSDLLKYYNQFVNTVNQLFYSNNLISCPLKHFIFSIQEKILRKKIKQTTHTLEQQHISSNEQARKLRKTREQNNNILLYEVKSFLQAYTSFVWMYLQLHLMAETRLGKIINSEILYGIVFKSVWGFVDWIAERGYEFEQAKLQEYYKSQNIKNEAKLSNQLIQFYSKIVQTLRNEKHPQQYLKKVVIFYRQVSKNCQNADQLLMIYEQILSRSIKERGSKELYLFRMRNIIQKLLKIDQNSMSGGEISYSWTTWCILIELLRQKINFQYGRMVISKQSFNNGQLNQGLSFTVQQSILKPIS